MDFLETVEVSNITAKPSRGSPLPLMSCEREVAFQASLLPHEIARLLEDPVSLTKTDTQGTEVLGMFKCVSHLLPGAPSQEPGPSSCTAPSLCNRFPETSASIAGIPTNTIRSMERV